MSYLIDRKKFFDGYRAKFGSLTQEQVDGLNALLQTFEYRYPYILIEQLAYILATAYHETAQTFQPIKERRAGRNQTKLRRLQDRYWGSGYYGRGYVQLTWRENYAKYANLLKEPLVKNPDLLLDPKISARVLFEGMLNHGFPKWVLGDFVNKRRKDYRQARRVVNLMDKAEYIADLAVKFEEILNRSKINGK